MSTVHFEDGEYAVYESYGLAWRWQEHGKAARKFDPDEFLYIREVSNPTPRFKIRWRRIEPLVLGHPNDPWKTVKERIAKYRSGLK